MSGSLLEGDNRMRDRRSVSFGTVFVVSIISSAVITAAGMGSLWYVLGNKAPVAPVTESTPISAPVFLDEADATIAAVEAVQPAVVSIVVEKDLRKLLEEQNSPFSGLSPFEGFNLFPYGPENIPEGFQQVGGGTGFIVSSDGLIITNRHVVDDEAAQYKVFLSDGRNFDATIVDLDEINDLAIIKIIATDLPTVTLGDSDAIQIGETVIAIGNSLSNYSNSVTKGIISGVGRSIYAADERGTNAERLEGVIQTDAAINPGNSGGPLIDLQGNVIGINTAVDHSGQLVGFAIPINDAKVVIDTVKEFGKIVRPQLGVRYLLINEYVQEANKLPVDHGAVVIRGENEGELAVIPGGPGDKAGIQENDIILEVDGVPITQENSLVKLIQQHAPGDAVTLKILGKGKEREVTVTLGTLE